MICSSVNLDRFIVRPSVAGLYSNREEVQELRSVLATWQNDRSWRINLIFDNGIESPPASSAKDIGANPRKRLLIQLRRYDVQPKKIVCQIRMELLGYQIRVG